MTTSDKDFWNNVSEHVMRYGPTFEKHIIERAEGSYIYNHAGDPILDFTSGQMSAVLGHSHPKIVETVQHQISTLEHIFSGMLSYPVVELSKRLGSQVAGLEKV